MSVSGSSADEHQACVDVGSSAVDGSAVPGCVFCKLAAAAASGHDREVVYCDELVYVVADIAPAAQTHLLVIPRNHVRDCDSEELSEAMLRHMRDVGVKMLQRAGHPLEQSRLGFHVPPCISQPHLHLHVLGGTFRAPCSHRCACCEADQCCAPCDCMRLKYTSWCCWYRDVDAQLRRMARWKDVDHGQPPIGQSMQEG